MPWNQLLKNGKYLKYIIKAEEKQLVSPDFRIYKYCIKVSKKAVCDLLLGITFMEPGAKKYKYILSMLWSKYYYYIRYTEEENEVTERLSNLPKVTQ